MAEDYDLPALRAQLLARLGEKHAASYPASLEGQFPRILERVVRDWGKAGLDAYLDELMLPERGGRRGFPPEVAVDILKLAAVHGELGLSPRHQGTGWAGIEDAELFRKAIKKEL